MNDFVLDQFRTLAAEMAGAPTNWQWIGKWESQRHFGITKERAERFAKKFGGEAIEMGSLDPVPEGLDEEWLKKGLY